jgi:ABC-2 type transport system ATP-binding protein
MKALDVVSVTKDFNGVKALDRVSLEVRRGEFFGLLGPNGAGKTTLLRILTGQLEQDGGSVSVLGRDNSDPVKIKEECGIVPEAESPPSFLTSQEFLELVCRIRSVDRTKEKIDRWMDFFDLNDKRDILCKDLSKGQRQKVMLASAFIHDPGILFLDEPFINLDPIYQRKVRDYLGSIKEKKCTIFMCTHILDLAEKLCERVAVINRGRVISTGTLEDIRHHHREGLEEIFMRLVEGD